MTDRHDAIILSDLHLGSENCQARSLCRFLGQIVRDELRTEKLVLNGDVFNSFDFRRLKKNHWKVLSLIRKLSDRLDIIWLCGNHDGSAEIVSHLLGTRVQDEYVLQSGGRRILILHGHVFDSFIDAHPLITLAGDAIYYLLLRVDRTHTVARLAKKSCKTFLRCARTIEERSRDYARRKGCVAVCCGHTHQAVVNCAADIHYFNSGCWTETPPTYLSVVNGVVRLETFTATEEPPAEHWDLAAAAGPGR